MSPLRVKVRIRSECFLSVSSCVEATQRRSFPRWCCRIGRLPGKGLPGRGLPDDIASMEYRFPNVPPSPFGVWVRDWVGVELEHLSGVVRA
ncbi:hypothetical protein QJS10_CPA16g00404 [Acorus calamus]|uniref:Uncharacterized protein n=1 Tax=Acorus calamus TaxID=4465 RepID=A0AAV9D2T9_ACOCL|nr:hypothetical protein QJS10_CPA16g00404 [Acorus calamus]